MNKNTYNQLINKLIAIGFLVYFIVLFTERIIGTTLGISQGGIYSISNGGTFFPFFATIVTYLATLIGLIFFIKPSYQIFKNLFSHNLIKLDYKWLSISSGVLLIGGMMHTGGTISWLQFIAYGFLIMSMVVVVIDGAHYGSVFGRVISLIYLVCYSMTIPVCYMMQNNGVLGISFLVIEIIGVFVLVPFFTYMMYGLFMSKGFVNFNVTYFIAVFVFALLAIALRWQEEINYFVLIALVCTTISFIIGISVFMRNKKKVFCPKCVFISEKVDNRHDI